MTIKHLTLLAIFAVIAACTTSLDSSSRSTACFQTDQGIVCVETNGLETGDTDVDGDGVPDEFVCADTSDPDSADNGGDSDGDVTDSGDDEADDEADDGTDDDEADDETNDADGDDEVSDSDSDAECGGAGDDGDGDGVDDGEDCDCI